jgi:hypothetical protein
LQTERQLGRGRGTGGCGGRGRRRLRHGRLNRDQRRRSRRPRRRAPGRRRRRLRLGQVRQRREGGGRRRIGRFDVHVRTEMRQLLRVAARDARLERALEHGARSREQSRGARLVELERLRDAAPYLVGCEAVEHLAPEHQLHVRCHRCPPLGPRQGLSAGVSLAPVPGHPPQAG